MFKFDKASLRMIGAAMSWPVIPLMGWLGLYLFGGAGAVIGCFLGMAVYFYGIWKALPKDVDKGSGGDQTSKGEQKDTREGTDHSENDKR